MGIWVDQQPALSYGGGGKRKFVPVDKRNSAV